MPSIRKQIVSDHASYGQDEFIEIAGKDTLRHERSNIHLDTYSFNVNKVEINCKDNRMHSNATLYYDINNALIETTEVRVGPDIWELIIPGSFSDDLKKIICE